MGSALNAIPMESGAIYSLFIVKRSIFRLRLNIAGAYIAFHAIDDIDTGVEDAVDAASLQVVDDGIAG